MRRWHDELDEPFVPVEDETALATVFAQPGPALLLLHDPYCAISSAAFREMAKLSHPVALVDVAGSPELSREIEARTGVRHQSPQAIVLVDGEAVWAASHFRVSEQAVTEALSRWGGPPAAA